jgi:hypothetical protein
MFRLRIMRRRSGATAAPPQRDLGIDQRRAHRACSTSIACDVRYRRKAPIHRHIGVAGSENTTGALMEYVIMAAFLVGLVVAGFGTTIFAGYEVARLVASAM